MVSPVVVLATIGAFVSFVFILDLSTIMEKGVAFLAFCAFVAILAMQKPSPDVLAHAVKAG